MRIEIALLCVTVMVTEDTISLVHTLAQVVATSPHKITALQSMLSLSRLGGVSCLSMRMTAAMRV